MKLLPKVLRRLIVVWCVYGLARLCILVNPLVVRLAELMFDWEISSADVAGTWVLLAIASGTCVFLCVLLHRFAAWLFNEKG